MLKLVENGNKKQNNTDSWSLLQSYMEEHVTLILILASSFFLLLHTNNDSIM